MNKWMLMGLICAETAISGCISVKSYVDPATAHTHYEDLARPAQAADLKVNVEFQRMGKHLPRADSELRGRVEPVLRGSGLINPSTSGKDGEITVIVNNVGDVGAAAAKGFGTGLTFGLVGSMVSDGYEMTVIVVSNGITVTKTGYTDALLSTVGNHAAPPGLSPFTPSAAFGVVVERMLLHALQDLQSQGMFAVHSVTWHRTDHFACDDVTFAAVLDWGEVRCQIGFATGAFVAADTEARTVVSGPL